MKFGTEIKVRKRRNVHRRQLKGGNRCQRRVRDHRPSVHAYPVSMPQAYVAGKPVKAVSNA
jgi:hypothetical protein